MIMAVGNPSWAPIMVTINVRHFPMFDDLHPPYDYGAPEQRRTGH